MHLATRFVYITSVAESDPRRVSLQRKQEFRIGGIGPLRWGAGETASARLESIPKI